MLFIILFYFLFSLFNCCCCSQSLHNSLFNRTTYNILIWTKKKYRSSILISVYVYFFFHKTIIYFHPFKWFIMQKLHKHFVFIVTAAKTHSGFPKICFTNDLIVPLNSILEAKSLTTRFAGKHISREFKTQIKVVFS